MCHNMRRFEKIAEEKKRRQKEQEIKFTVEDQQEILVNAGSGSNKPQKGQSILAIDVLLVRLVQNSISSNDSSPIPCQSLNRAIQMYLCALRVPIQNLCESL